MVKEKAKEENAQRQKHKSQIQKSHQVLSIPYDTALFIEAEKLF